MRLFDPNTGEWLKNLDEEQEARLAAETIAQEERDARLAAKDENRRLRQLLEQMQSNTDR